MKLHIIPFLFIAVFFVASQGNAQKLRIETQDSQKFVIHKVQEKETLWSITHTYDISQENLVKYNPGIDKVLKTGTEIRVLYAEVENPKLQSSNTTLEATNVEIKHTVAKGEWLTKIAKEFDVSVAELQKWNDLDGEKITPGQELIVGIGKSKSSTKNNVSQGDMAKNNDKSTDKKDNDKGKILKSAAPDGTLIIHTVEPKETLAALKRTYGTSIAEIKEWNSLESDEINVGQKLKIYTDTPLAAVAKTEPTGFEWVKETPAAQSGSGAIGLDQFVNPNDNPSRGGNNLDPIYTQAFVAPLQIPVISGMTIYKLQNQYNVRKTEIRYWNSMPPNSNELTLGKAVTLYPPQQLFHQVKQGETLKAIADFYDVSTRQIEIWNNFEQNQGETKKQVGQNLVIFKRTGPKPTPQFEEAAKLEGVNTTVVIQQQPTYQQQPVYQQPVQQQPVYQQPVQQQPTYQQPVYQQPVQQQPTYQTHTVAQGEYLFDIAQRYNVQMRDLKEWNNLPAVGNPAPGTQLRVYNGTNSSQGAVNTQTNDNGFNQNNQNNNPNRGGATTQQPATTTNPYTNPYDTNYKYETSSTSDDPFNQLNGATKVQSSANNNNTASTYGNNSYTGNSSANNFGGSEYKSNTDKYLNNGQNNNSNASTTPSATNGVNVTEKGYADATSIPNARPFVALHRTAPVGTMMIVKNPITGANTVVEVVANMNPNTAKAGVVIEVTNAVFSRLGAVPGQLLQIELSYTVNQR